MPGLITIKPGTHDEQAAGTWWRMGHGIWLRAPCGHVAVLDHTIEPDGTVTPSVVCPRAPQDCDWHEWVRLEDWNAGLRTNGHDEASSS